MRVLVLAGGRSLERAVSERSRARASSSRCAASGTSRSSSTPATTSRGGCATTTSTARSSRSTAAAARTGRCRRCSSSRACRTRAPTRPPARASDKATAKRMLVAAGLPTPAFAALSASAVRDLGADALLDRLAERVGLPLVVKPCVGGSGFGIRRVGAVDELPAALLKALAYDDAVLCEAFVAGREVTVTVLRGQALAAVETIPLGGAEYDFDARYTPGASDFVAPADVGEEPLRLAEQACALLGCAGFARVDFLVPADGPPQLLEVNVVPGLTETSTAPLAAEAVGKPFEELVADLLADAVARP